MLLVLGDLVLRDAERGRRGRGKKKMVGGWVDGSGAVCVGWMCKYLEGHAFFPVAHD